MSVFSSDKLSGAFNANLTARVGEIGATWAAHPLSQGSIVLDGQGHAYSTTAGAATFDAASGVTTNSSYSVSVTLTPTVIPYQLSTVTVAAAGVLGYVNTATFTMYLARYNFSGLNQWELYKVVNNVATLLGSSPATLVTYTNYRLRLVLAPNSQQLQVSTDSGTTYATLVTATDSAVPFTGVAGLHGLGDQSTYGLQLASFVAADTTSVLNSTSPSIYKAATTNTILALGPVFSNFVDEHGLPLKGQLRSPWGSDTVIFPNVVVKVRATRATYYNGKGLIGQDLVTGLFLYGYYIFDAQLRLTVQTRSEPEREWLVDTLLSAVPALAVNDSTVTPNVPRAGAVEDALGAFGIVVKGHGEVDYKEPNLKDTRPEGEQVYEATIPFICDFSLGWEVAGVSVPQVLIAAGPQTNSILPPAVTATVHA